MAQEKFFPEIGTELYLYKRTGNECIDEMKTPYTVIGVSKQHVTIQKARCIFNGPQYFDTLADDIVPDPNGHIVELHWAPKKGRWQWDPYSSGYPSYACFGKYEYFPYLD